MHDDLICATFGEDVSPVSQFDALREIVQRNLVDASTAINGHQLGQRADERLRRRLEGLIFARQVPVAAVAWIQHVAYKELPLPLHTEMNIGTGERRAVNGCNVVAHCEQAHAIGTVERGTQVLETKVVGVISNRKHVLHSSLDGVQIDEATRETIIQRKPDHLQQRFLVDGSLDARINDILILQRSLVMSIVSVLNSVQLVWSLPLIPIIRLRQTQGSHSRSDNFGHSMSRHRVSFLKCVMAPHQFVQE